MEEKLLTAGQFAKLARTTKRTVTWYSDKGILSPTKVGETGYRYYKDKQILDFQVILLLRKLGFSIEEINNLLRKSKSLEDLFRMKRSVVAQEINDLKIILNNLENYYKNLEQNGTLVSPKVKVSKPFSIYSIQKEGPYAKIKDYCLELISCFNKIPKDSIYLTMFLERNYLPGKAKMKIGVIVKGEMVLKEKSKGLVEKDRMPSYKTLSYTHIGSGSVLSMLWQELGKYARQKRYREDSSLPFKYIEFYKKTSLNGFENEEGMIFEINMPIL